MLHRTLLRTALAVLPMLAVPATADWIRTRDGALIETRGPWEVKGSIVVFTTPAGTLSSLRLSYVDLDASAVATFDANSAPEQETEDSGREAVAEKEPVLVMTNKDISQARPNRARSGEGGAGEEDAESGDGSSSSDDPQADGDGPQAVVEVVSWYAEENEQEGGVEILGTVQNKGTDIETDLRVMVRLYGEDGQFLGAASAFLGSLSLAPNVTTRLRAVFPQVNASELDPRFVVRSNRIQIEGVIAPQQASESEI